MDITVTFSTYLKEY